MSFESLVDELMRDGKSRTSALKIAGSIANAKLKGAGSGPTAAQKARMKKLDTLHMHFLFVTHCICIFLECIKYNTTIVKFISHKIEQLRMFQFYGISI